MTRNAYRLYQDDLICILLYASICSDIHHVYHVEDHLKINDFVISLLGFLFILNIIVKIVATVIIIISTDFNNVSKSCNRYIQTLPRSYGRCNESENELLLIFEDE